MTLNEQALKFCTYLSFKMDCLAEQEANPLTIDLVKAQALHDELSALKQEKVVQLAKAMPKRNLTTTRTKPKNTHKKDGSLSVAGERWYSLLKELKLPETTVGPVKEVIGQEDGNPNSPDQVKAWLYSLGWQPRTYKFVRDKTTGDERQIEQVRKDGELCESVRELVDKDPAIEILDGLTVINHRLGVVGGFLKNAKPFGSVECSECGGKGSIDISRWGNDGLPEESECEDCPKCFGLGVTYGKGHVVASAGGLTNTLRFKHREPIVNLPGVDKPYGKEIRGCIVSPDKLQCVIGADVSSLESCTKRHYMWTYDPEYVQEMSQPGFDEHLDLAKFAGVITQEDIEQYNRSQPKHLKAVRNKYKPANYAGIYGIGKDKLARELGCSVKEAKTLLDAYWQRNWAVKKVAGGQYVKTISDGTMWLCNPVNGYYYSLRYDKDRFSTLNQGTGAYVFDLWVMFMRKVGVVVSAQMHDEVLVVASKKGVDSIKEKMYGAMRKVNDALQLNVEMTIEAKDGQSYAEVH